MAGIQDPDTIDLVTHDNRTDEFALVMCESRPWGTDHAQVDQLIAKINSYAAYVLDEGFLVAHPEVSGKPIRIQIDCVDAPDPEAAQVIEQASRLLAEYGIAFLVNRLDPAT
jgi:hypothetical protein